MVCARRGACMPAYLGFANYDGDRRASLPWQAWNQKEGIHEALFSGVTLEGYGAFVINEADGTY